ncbi:MAG: hypothetical protein UV75_C0001G0061 [Candidatus Giovannonibacteria bacterium GW2011_GWA1_43_15]|uniref:Uncharacterized protein n=1 Tax=Candidatus Giovannonibacteria bacterium GW2011_GWA2_44_26 TaxID=1618648 RepID=A0A0G1L4U6_9BACT|nr:MAG: hypothetical protein UV72_C0002G0106 [Candidatus Giovannonibacteria bacterium GW2011_GWB1_43_13]KKS99896.1 MAG: hypothetical protein UV75_C0001G0061 [Candidatus Giovannonibacteria bacterium GW2011_GWA1_43_15]KKT63597.1 MAG: hypothetical protein UW55_C0002G0062 [Candidatus Giovannonibacteria bacterium GW2011_GWA2_44_26]
MSKHGMSMDMGMSGNQYQHQRLIMTPRIRRLLNPQLVKARTALPKKGRVNRNKAPHP